MFLFLPSHYLNNFHTEPAISKFVWHFTPKNKSSENLATFNGSFLHFIFHSVSNCSFLAHLVSGPFKKNSSVLFKLAFTSPSFSFKLFTFLKDLQIHYTKGTLSFFQTLTATSMRFPVLFHSASLVYFNFHSRYSFAIGQFQFFVFEDWSSVFLTLLKLYSFPHIISSFLLD